MRELKNTELEDVAGGLSWPIIEVVKIVYKISHEILDRMTGED